MTIKPSGYARAKNDLYETEAWATNALIRRFPVDGKFIWEPAAGNHAIADVLRLAGATVLTSDIATYDREHDLLRDFLEDEIDSRGLDGIITNPPYGWHNQTAEKFIKRALGLVPLVAMLLPVKFDSGKTRLPLMAGNASFLGKIVLVDRIQLVPGTTVDGTEDHAWFIWDQLGRWDGGNPILMYEGRDAG